MQSTPTQKVLGQLIIKGIYMEILQWQTCKYCEKSEWFLRLTSKGLCDNCNKILSSRIKRAIQIISKTTEKIDQAKRLKTKLSQLSLIEDAVDKHIFPLERKGIKAINQTSYSILKQVKNWRDEIILEYLDDLLNKVKIKVKKTKAEELKINAYSEVLKAITELKDKVSKTDIISNFEIKVKQQIDEIILNALHDTTNSTKNQIILESDLNQKERINKLFAYWV